MSSSSKMVFCAISIVAVNCGDDNPRDSGSAFGTSNAPGGPPDSREPVRPEGSSILVLVEDLAGAPIAGAAVVPTLREPDSTPVGALPGEPRSVQRQTAVLTNSEGLALLESLQPGNFTFEISREGYSSSVGRAQIPENEDLARLHRVQLQPMHVERFHPGDGAVIESSGATVTIAPNSLVYESGHETRVHPVTHEEIGRDLRGQPVQGEVVAELAVVNPYAMDPRALPGPLLGVRSPGDPETPLISAGMLEFRMTSDGHPVQPAPGSLAELTLPVDSLPADVQAEVLSSGAIDKWYLDPVDGTWIHDGQWILAKDPRGAPILYGLQSHFSWINADKPCLGTEPCFQCHILQVLDAEGQGIEDLLVTIPGDPWHSGRTGPEGKICVELPKGTPVALSVCGKQLTLSDDPQKPTLACADSKNFWLGDHPKATSDEQCTVDELHCDDDPACNPNSWRYCTKDDVPEEGICTEGRQFCVDGQWSACGDSVKPKAEETCGTEPALDDNCNGIVDDNCAACTPMEEQDCYNGPLDQLNHCPPGKQVCDFNNVWGKCDAVGPTPELCGNPIDENCDGQTDCFGGADWGRAIDQDGFDVRGTALALSADSSSLFVGLEVTRKGNEKDFDVGDGKTVKILDPIGDSATVLVKYDTTTWIVQWAKALTATGSQRIGDVAVIEGVVNNIPVTEVYVVGTTRGDLPEVVGDNMCDPNAAVPLGDEPNIFLAKFSGSGQCLRHVALTEKSSIVDVPRLAFLDDNGDRDAVVVAAFEGSIPGKDGCPQVDSFGAVDGLAMRVRGGLEKGDSGHCLARHLIHGADKDTEEFPQAIAVAPDGSLGIAGYAVGGPLADQDGFVRRIGSNGNVLDWGNPQDTLVSSPGDQRFTAIAFSNSAEMVVAGHTQSTTKLSNCEGFDADSVDGFVLYDLKNADGACGRLTGTDDQHVRDIALWEGGPPAKDVLLAGTTLGKDPTGVKLFSPAPAGTHIVGKMLDGVAGRLNVAEGSPWLQRFPRAITNGVGDEPDGMMSNQTAWRLVVTKTGAVLMTGWYSGGIGFSKDPAPLNFIGDNARESGFVVRLFP